MHSSGQSLTEYGLVVGLVALVSIAGLQVLGGSLTSQLSSLTDMFMRGDGTHLAVTDHSAVVTHKDSRKSSADPTPGRNTERNDTAEKPNLEKTLNANAKVNPDELQLAAQIPEKPQATPRKKLSSGSVSRRAGHASSSGCNGARNCVSDVSRKSSL